MKVLLSAHQSGFTNQQNTAATKSLVRWLCNNRMSYEPCEGVYKGKKETSFLIKVGKEALPMMHDKANELNQECILVMNDNGSNAYLWDNDGNLNSLGKFKQVFKFIATMRDSYTILHGRYYIAA